jgi:hypothetical protein
MWQSAKVALPTATWHTVGKGFANCHASSRQSHVAPSALTAGFADCWFLGSRQRKNFFFEIFFADCFWSCSWQRKRNFFLKYFLPTAFVVAVGKERFFFEMFFSAFSFQVYKIHTRRKGGLQGRAEDMQLPRSMTN